MKTRRFHQLESELNGLDIFHKWTRSEKKPIGDTDISLIYKGKVLEDSTVDFIAVGKTLIPCLTKENLVEIIRQMTPEELNELRTAMGF